MPNHFTDIIQRTEFWRDLKTIPNILSLFRLSMILLATGLVLSGWILIGLAIAIPAALTDYFDGYIARKNGSVTHLGALLDSLADLIYALVCLSVAVYYQLWPVYLLVVWGIRDMTVMALRASAAQQGFDIPTIYLAKVGVNFNFYAFLMLGIDVYLTQRNIGGIFRSWIHGIGLMGIHSGLSLYWISGVFYFRSYIKQYHSDLSIVNRDR